MTNSEKKHQKFKSILSKHKHLENYCEISASGLDDDNIYFHITFKLSENDYIVGQSDIGSNHGIPIYAIRYCKNDGASTWSVEIHGDILDAIIIGHRTNKEAVGLALDTLSKVRNHINNLNAYTTDYITHILIGNSVKETSDLFINEIKSTSMMVEFLQKQTQKQ